MEGPQMMSNLSTHNQPALLNTTEIKTSIYVFTPAGFTFKLVIVSLLVTVGIIGFVGNVLIYYFISRKKQNVPHMKLSPFQRNLNFYIKSLALSDVLSNIISLPLVCINLTFDVFMNSVGCKIVRFFALLFTSITMNNIIVITVERYLATRDVPRTFSASTVRKLVYGAWIVGFFLALGPTATYNPREYDLNNTHYTVVCKPDNSNFVSRVIAATFALVQHLLPSIILTYLNFSVAKTMWTRQKRRVDVQRDNAIRAAARADTRRGTYLLVAVTFAFIIPISASLYYGIYFMLAQPSLDFQTDYITRALSTVSFYSNSSVNFIIYVIQMKDFRAFLKKIICARNNDTPPNPAGDEI